MKMIDEHFVRLRAHRNNIHRYRGLLRGNLTHYERQFVERRLAEESLAMQNITASAVPLESMSSSKSAVPQPPPVP
ncbi:hypothetical protein [Bradyrhizobium canariense]|uniref:hypothetical protein n=1 Tax=Bradyrhizobium canariense TaxID=255045 RepID=UPI002012B432|nr:hypothetical protein [Bradyrhizobium canariense]